MVAMQQFMLWLLWKKRHQVELSSRGRDQPKTALKQTIDHTANLTSSSARLDHSILISCKLAIL